MHFFKLLAAILFCGILPLSGCQNNPFEPESRPALAFKDIPAVRLNYRYEADVPAPTINAGTMASATDRHAAVQADFDAARPLELLERTLASPDNRRVLAVYRRLDDVQAEYRLDMYSPEGRLIKKLTSEMMAVHFPDTIVWSPDSSSLAFVAMIRAVRADPAASPSSAGEVVASATPTPDLPDPDAEPTGDGQEPAAPATSTPPVEPTPAAPTGILTFRTEQIYICDADGNGVKAITENEGLIYFYYAWSPDSTMLAALATSAREWRYLDVLAASKGEVVTPQGRPRIIERNGRERRLDDNITSVRPVWSPDSSKVATAFENQIRIYDAQGTNPTQAAVPLRNQLLLSAQAYDRAQQRQLQAENSEVDANSNAPTPVADEQASTLPDKDLLVSYNPIVEVAWTADELLYLKTAYVKRMQNPAENVMSFSRWHRLILSAQPIAPVR